jgi:hypothetical protein
LCLSLGYLGVSRFLIVRFGAFQSFLTARRFLLSEEPRTVALVSSRDLDLKEKAPPTASRRLCGNAKGLGVKGCAAAKAESADTTAPFLAGTLPTRCALITRKLAKQESVPGLFGGFALNDCRVGVMRKCLQRAPLTSSLNP